MMVDDEEWRVMKWEDDAMLKQAQVTHG